MEGDWPVTVAEVKVFLPEAVRLKVDGGARAGFEVLDSSAAKIGYAVRTMPESQLRHPQSCRGHERRFLFYGEVERPSLG